MIVSGREFRFQVCTGIIAIVALSFAQAQVSARPNNPETRLREYIEGLMIVNAAKDGAFPPAGYEPVEPCLRPVYGWYGVTGKLDALVTGIIQDWADAESGKIPEATRSAMKGRGPQRRPPSHSPGISRPFARASKLPASFPRQAQVFSKPSRGES